MSFARLRTAHHDGPSRSAPTTSRTSWRSGWPSRYSSAASVSWGIASSAAGGRTTRSTVTAIPSTADGHERPASSVSRSGAAGSSSCSTDVRCHGLRLAAVRTDGSSWRGQTGLGAQHLLRPDQREHPHRAVPPGLGDVLLDLADGVDERGQCCGLAGGFTHRFMVAFLWEPVPRPARSPVRVACVLCASPGTVRDRADAGLHTCCRRRGLPRRDLRKPAAPPEPGASTPTRSARPHARRPRGARRRRADPRPGVDRGPLVPAARVRQRDPHRVGHARDPVRARASSSWAAPSGGA